jgi:arginase
MKPMIALIGLPTDVNSSFERGPASAPSVIREALWSDRGNLACSNGSAAHRKYS